MHKKVNIKTSFHPNSIDSGLAKIITIGLEACSIIFQGLLKALEQGSKSIYSPITWQYRHRNKITKKPPRVLPVLKEGI